MPKPPRYAYLTNNRSLQRQVSLWTVIVLLFMALGAGGYAFWQGYQEATEYQQDNLKNIAALFGDRQARFPIRQDYRHFLTQDSEGGLSVDIFRLPLRRQPNLPATMVAYEQLDTIPTGSSEQTINSQLWQVFRQDSPTHIIIVRQRSDLQNDIAKSGAVQSALPLLIAMVMLAVFLPVLIWWMLRPLRQVAEQIDQRQNNDLSPLPVTHLPTEILPLVHSINQLFGHVAASIQAQQQFIADASHELRSPLTAISLQVQRLQRLPSDSQIETGLEKLALRVKRNQDLVEQLLTLARVNLAGQYATPIVIQPTVEQVINLLLPIADDKHITLNLQRHPAHAVIIDETALLLLVKNILQNAMLYTPPHGTVTVLSGNLGSLMADTTPAEFWQHHQLVIPSDNDATVAATVPNIDLNTPILRIIDSGRGVHPADYQAMFEPFVRLNASDPVANRADTQPTPATTASLTNGQVGTGLGLSIVKSICEQANIALYLAPANLALTNFDPTNFVSDHHPDQRGLCVTLVFFNFV